ncbi:MAG: hypothetical protein I4O51_12765 [Flavobacterium micromati]|nr:hypothetical protein [Flavobacterium micromati]
MIIYLLAKKIFLNVGVADKRGKEYVKKTITVSAFPKIIAIYNARSTIIENNFR